LWGWGFSFRGTSRGGRGGPRGAGGPLPVYECGKRSFPYSI